MVIAVSDYLRDAFYLYMYIEEQIVYQTERGRGEHDTLKLVSMFYKRRLHINKVKSRMTDGQKDSQGSRLHHQQCYQDRFMTSCCL